LYETVDTGISEPEIFINDLSHEAPEWEGEDADLIVPDEDIEPEFLTMLK